MMSPRYSDLGVVVCGLAVARVHTGGEPLADGQPFEQVAELGLLVGAEAGTGRLRWAAPTAASRPVKSVPRS